MDQRLQRLMHGLAEAINVSLSDSEQIAGVIARIETGGYDVFLVLEATIGFNRRDDDTEPASVAPRNEHDAELKVSPQDVKSLRITLEGEDFLSPSNRPEFAVLTFPFGTFSPRSLPLITETVLHGPSSQLHIGQAE